MRPLCIRDEDVGSLFPLDLSGEVMALRACVDASTQGGLFTVAAVAFGHDRAVKANREWERVMGGRTFHMTDLHNRKGEFEGADDDYVRSVIEGTVDIVRRHASYMVAISCDVALLADALPTVSSKEPDSQSMLAAFRSAYGMMCHFAMAGLGNRATHNRDNPGRHISYIFEKGDEGQRGVLRYLDFLQESKDGGELFLDLYSYNRHTVTPKGNLEGIFHASDLVAWEWGRHVRRHKANEPMRRSLAALVGDTPSASDEYGITLSDGWQCFMRYFSPERFEAPLAFFRETISADTVEGAQAAFSRYREIHPAREA